MLLDNFGTIELDETLLEKNTFLLCESTEYINKDILALKQLLDEMNECWSGNAQKAFNKQTLLDIEYIININNELKKTADNFKFAVNTYRQSENRAEEALKAIN